MKTTNAPSEMTEAEIKIRQVLLRSAGNGNELTDHAKGKLVTMLRSKEASSLDILCAGGWPLVRILIEYARQERTQDDIPQAADRKEAMDQLAAFKRQQNPDDAGRNASEDERP